MKQTADFTPGRREAVFALLCLVWGIGLCNSLFYGGCNLGFALGTWGLILSCWIYLRKSGCRFSPYARGLLILSLLNAGGFARTDDGGLKFLAWLLILFAVSLGLCLGAGQNRRRPGSGGSLLDAPRAVFIFGFGSLGGTLSALAAAGKTEATGKKGGGAILGILLALPVLAVVCLLLIRADAAFEAVMDVLPRGDGLQEWLTSGFFGLAAAALVYSQSLGLSRRPREAAAAPREPKVQPITGNIVLGAVSALYLVYLFSQLAYLGGGFVGLLPEDATLSAYARRGFFEMALLGTINLGLILLAAALTRREGKLSGLTRGLCLFLGAVTLFLIAASGAKMLLYISGYGLTRLRVLTQVFMLWLAVVVILVAIWLFRPEFGWMKGGVLLALALSAGLLWMDVDAWIARYNVIAYQEGRLETIDLPHLSVLSDGAVPYIARLTGDRDPLVAETARDILTYWDSVPRDLRSWNAASAAAYRNIQSFRE